MGVLIKVQRLGKARQPDLQKCINRTLHPSWFDKRVGPIIGRNVGEIQILYYIKKPKREAYIYLVTEYI